MALLWGHATALRGAIVVGPSGRLLPALARVAGVGSLPLRRVAVPVLPVSLRLRMVAVPRSLR
eukprot:CAMPEP_0175759922 /NCGR_PEP_ID=MMETSP0097-20121207/65827_1 /TAXON_ID=311494 /ORGANISM="Alexandrium monilatum, Strain CCMP3105" /LENGTH=62 /DNA_ID=CAMNT_0017069347 /DNA_START=54 /DNA_END=239 /DNA_ORIENTATION=-